MGKNEDGIASALKVKRIEERKGVGKIQQEENVERQNEEWWLKGFQRAAENVGAKKNRKRKTQKQTMEEIYKITKGKGLGRKRQKGKIKRVERGGES